MSSDAKWLKWYGDIPHTLEYPDISLYDIIYKTSLEYPNNIAYDFMGKSVSYKEFISQIDTCAKALKIQGVKEEDVVTVCLPNVPQAIIMFYAINKLGAIASMIHPLSVENEILFYLNETKSKIAITLTRFFNKFEAIKGKTQVERVIECKIEEGLGAIKGFMYKFIGHEPKVSADPWAISWPEFLQGANKCSEKIVPKGKGQTSSVILFSGGTTGTSKGILLTNLNFNAFAIQTAVASQCLEAGDIMLSVMPVFHGFGLGVGIHAMLIYGGQCVLVPQLDVKKFASLFKKYRPNYMAGVPTLFEAMLRNEEMQSADLSCLKGLFSGGDSLSVELKRKIDAFIKERGANIQVREGYGATECVSACCLTPIDNYREGSIGIPVPDMFFKIVISGTNDEAPTGQLGEICISGPSVMQGYINNPKETVQTLRTHDDGKVYLHTGDLGYMDEDGFIYFVQRLKRMIITSGYNVYPSQIENVIDSHEAVSFSTVIGVKDDYRIQRVKAFVVLKPGFSPTEDIKESIKAHCEKSIAKYALPREYEFRDSLPKTLVGKVAYRELEKEEEEKTLV